MAPAEPAGGGEGAGLFGRGEPRHMRKVVRLETLDEKPCGAAAALAEIGAEHLLLDHRLGAGTADQPLRGTERLPFERPAADGAVKAAGRGHDHAGAGLARGRALHRQHADQRAGFIALEDRLYGAPDQHRITPPPRPERGASFAVAASESELPPPERGRAGVGVDGGATY